MARKDYTLKGTLTGQSGKTYAAEAKAHMVPALQAVLFALPSDAAVYPEDRSDWFLEFKVLYTDQLVAEFFDRETDELVLTSSRQVKGGRVNLMTWQMLTGRHTVPEGTYRVRVYGQQHPSYAKEFQVVVRTGSRPVLPITVTGDIMPNREDSDREIWEKMMAPATVIDIRNVAHQRVYQEPDYDSRVLGSLHGQSQCLSVLEIRDPWVRISAWSHERGQPVEGWVPKKVLKVVLPQTEYGILVDKKSRR